MDNIVRLSNGPRRLSTEFERVKRAIEENNLKYHLCFCLLKHLPMPEKMELAELIHAHIERFPHLYVKKDRRVLRKRVLLMLGLPLPLDLQDSLKTKKKRKTIRRPTKASERLLAFIYNDGQHVYMGNVPQHAHGKPDLRKMYFISYRAFCGNGGYIFGDMKLQHLGHIFGVHGGRAELRLTVWPNVWSLVCEPRVLYRLVEHECRQILYERRV